MPSLETTAAAIAGAGALARCPLLPMAQARTAVPLAPPSPAHGAATPCPPQLRPAPPSPAHGAATPCPPQLRPAPPSPAHGAATPCPPQLRPAPPKDMRACPVRPNSYGYVVALKACSTFQDLKTCKQIHVQVIENGLELDVFVGTVLVDAYAKCGSLVDARSVFEALSHRDVVSWSAMISGYAQMKEGEVALQLYARMQREGVIPNDRTFVGALKACSSLAAKEDGDIMSRKKQSLKQTRAIHADVVMGGYESNVFVGTMLVDTYAKCGTLADARQVFEKMPQRNVVSWTAMILGYAHMEEGEEALQLYAKMQQEGVMPNDRTFVGALKACSSLTASEVRNAGGRMAVKSRCLEQARAIHSDLLKSGSDLDTIVGTILVDVYAKCGSLVDARQTFDQMCHRDVVSWNAMILGYAQAEEGANALQLFAVMQQEGLVPNGSTFVGALMACASLGAFQRGKEIHVQKPWGHRAWKTLL